MRNWLVIACLLLLLGAVPTEAADNPADAKSEKEIRATLESWVAANNRKDHASANTIWAPGVVGWYPKVAEFSLSAAFAVAGFPEKKGTSWTTVELQIEDIAVSGSVAAVHDIWRETMHFEGSRVTVRRLIYGSELWRRQGDGKWRIARWVSAPEKWERVQP